MIYSIKLQRYGEEEIHISKGQTIAQCNTLVKQKRSNNNYFKSPYKKLTNKPLYCDNMISLYDNN